MTLEKQNSPNKLFISTTSFALNQSKDLNTIFIIVFLTSFNKNISDLLYLIL